jgi:hypothetical protein
MRVDIEQDIVGEGEIELARAVEVRNQWHISTCSSSDPILYSQAMLWAGLNLFQAVVSIGYHPDFKLGHLEQILILEAPKKHP